MPRLVRNNSGSRIADTGPEHIYNAAAERDRTDQSTTPGLVLTSSAAPAGASSTGYSPPFPDRARRGAEAVERGGLEISYAHTGLLPGSNRCRIASVQARCR